jgi:hypothetical protein
MRVPFIFIEDNHLQNKGWLRQFAWISVQGRPNPDY